MNMLINAPNFYHPNDKTFKAGESLVYIAELPAHLAHSDRPRNVARKELFKLEQRNDNELIFKSGNGYKTEYRAKVLKSPSSGVEICLVSYRGSRLLLEATRYMHGGRSITKKDMTTLITEDGQTLGEFLKATTKTSSSCPNWSTSLPCHWSRQCNPPRRIYDKRDLHIPLRGTLQEMGA